MKKNKSARKSAVGKAAPHPPIATVGTAGVPIVVQNFGLVPAQDIKKPRALVGAAARSVAGAAARQGLQPHHFQALNSAEHIPPAHPSASVHTTGNPQLQAHMQKSLSAASMAFKGVGQTAALPSQNSLAASSAVTRDPDEHPFEAGHCLVVSYRDNSPRLAKILALAGNRDEKNWQYYVHYFDFNRRMDEWVRPERVLKLPSVANELGREWAEAEAALQKLKHPGPSGGLPGSASNPSIAGGVAAHAADASSSISFLESPRRKRGRGGNRKAPEPDAEMQVPITLYEENGKGRDGTANQENNDMDEDDNDEEEEEEADEDEEEDEPQGGGGGGGGGGAYGTLRKSAAVSGSSSSRTSTYTSAVKSTFQEQRKKLLGVASDAEEDGITTIDQLEHDEHEGLDAAQLLEHEEWTKIKNINNVQLGRYIMECWYFSPFPKEFHPDGPVDCLYFCEFTLRFFRFKEELVRYQNKPNLPRHPPGNEIYRDAKVSMFELDGAVEKIYCQNLCYFAKLFLDHKTLVYDVDPFLFYVLCTQDDRGYHPVGYFSKEKYSEMGYNLACILTFPSAQRQGYGRFLIAFSYELSKKESKIGSPEKPLSDLGNLSYRSYWAGVVLDVLRAYPNESLSIYEISKITSIMPSDVILTLEMLQLLQVVDGEHVLVAAPEVLEDLTLKYPQNGLEVNPEKLHWAPLYVTDPKKDRFKFATT